MQKAFPQISYVVLRMLEILDELIDVSDDKSVICINYKPLDPDTRAHISVNDLLNWLTVNGYAELHFCFETANEVIHQLKNASGIESHSSFILAEQRNGSVRVRITNDRMKAYLNVTGPAGGKPVSGNDILNTLKTAGILKGINKRALQELHLMANSLTGEADCEMLVAQGKFPLDGSAAKIKYCVSDSRVRIRRPKRREDGTVDMRNLGKDVLTPANTLLAEVVPAIEGEPGYTIFGDILACEQADSFDLVIYPNTYINKVDHKLYSAVDGVAIHHEDGVEIEDVLTVENVTVGTGHIIFDGSVFISGDVLPMMKVEAKGNVVVGGSVELGHISAYEDVVVYGGVIGKPNVPGNELGATIVSKTGNIEAKFAQYATLKAKGNISVYQHLIHCKTDANGDLIVVDEFERSALLVGGIHKVCGSLKAVVIGNDVHVPTYISAYRTLAFHLLEDAKVMNIINSLQNEFDLLKEREKNLIKANKPDLYKDEITKIKMRKNEISNELVTLNKKHDVTCDSLPRLYKQHSITCLNSLYAGVYCEVGSGSVKISNDRGPSRIVATDAGVEVQNIL